jgi:multiple sugar transport system permease protein
MREQASVRWLRRVGLAAFAVGVGVPIYVMALTSLTPLADVGDRFSWLPDRLSFQPYVDLWSTVPLVRAGLNGLAVAATTVLLTLALAVPSAYAAARTRLPGRQAFLALLLAVQAVPGLFFLVPLFLVYSEARHVGLQLIGTRTGLVVTDLALTLPFATWFLSTHLGALPRDLEDAARVDGADGLTLFRHAVLPLAGPGIAAAGVLAFVVSWGEVVFASVLTRGETQTVPVALQHYVNQTGVLWNQLTAAALVSAVPAVLGVLLARRLLRDAPVR